jgi:hypothetical protein
MPKLAGIIFNNSNRKGLVWNENLIRSLEEKRIIGMAVNNKCPCVYSSEQVKICLVLNLCKVYLPVHHEPLPDDVEKYESFKELEWEEFNLKKVEYSSILRQIHVNNTDIPLPDRPIVPQIAEPNSANFPWYSEQPIMSLELGENELKYKIFEYFYEKQFYITDGLKFGGDYLLYFGHPDTCHSSFIVCIVDYNSILSNLDLISHSRVATTVNKKQLYAFWNTDTECIEVLSSKWTSWVA